VQLALQNSGAFSVLETYYSELHQENRLPLARETHRLSAILLEMLAFYDRSFIVIDGLDECGENVGSVLDVLKRVSDNPQVSMALFSRAEQDIREELEDEFTHIEIAAHTEDIELFVLAQMNERKALKSTGIRNPKLHEEIRLALVQGAKGMCVERLFSSSPHYDSRMGYLSS